jgi:hypothetical protein
MQKCDVCGKEMVSGMVMHKKTHKGVAGESYFANPPKSTGDIIDTAISLPQAVVSSANTDKILDQLYKTLADGAYRAKLKHLRETINISIADLKAGLELMRDEIREGELKTAINLAISQL